MMGHYDCHEAVDQGQLQCLSWTLKDLKKPFIQRSSTSLCHSSHKTPQKILLRICESRFQNLSWIRLLLTTSAATTLDQAAFISQVFLLLLLCLLFWVYFSLAFTLTFEKLDCITALHKSLQWLPMTESVLARHNSQLLLQPVLAM